MKLFSVLFLFISLSASACPNLTGEYANCKNILFGSSFNHVDLSTTYIDGIYTVHPVIDGKDEGFVTEGENIVFGKKTLVSCVNKSIIFDQYEGNDIVGSMILKLNWRGDLEQRVEKDGLGVTYTCKKM